MRVRIIVDSTTDLAPELQGQVEIVPLTVSFGTEEYIDGVTITHEEFYNKLIESDVLPTTSQATLPHSRKSSKKLPRRETAPWSSPWPLSSPAPARAPGLPPRITTTSMW